MLIKETKYDDNQTRPHWMNWLEPIRYLNENQSKFFLDKLNFEKLDLSSKSLFCLANSLAQYNAK